MRVSMIWEVLNDTPLANLWSLGFDYVCRRPYDFAHTDLNILIKIKRLAPKQ